MSNRPQLLYLAFGAEIYQREAIFSIVSSLARGTLPDWDIRVFTDAPHFFSALPVATHPIEPQWNGPHGYPFRIKHAALREVLRRHKVAALVDTDTFFHDSPSRLFERILPGQLLCNSIGQRLVDSDHSAAFMAALERKGLLDTSLRQTNSGVIGLHTDDAGLLDRSIELMDELQCTAHQVYTFEEICLAVAAHGHLRLEQCPDLLHHYWSRKAQFRAKIMAWNNKHQQAPMSDEALADAIQVNARVPRPPRLLRNLHKFVSLAVPAQQRQFIRESLYGCYHYPNEFDRACTPVWWEKALENAERRKGQRLDASTLKRWLNHPILRTLAGQFHPELSQHLVQIRRPGDID
ncbi:hypothetical protein [Ectopseudomonas alcaliphila]|uniref:Nucleotide-diphospho-sugar transferase domain-containing protein n=1 Tax=Ectopseudomonas alcaliphila TaxID=101564 RepID=A0A1G6Y9H7_9GAMM|nr:hypothetical protein [Pseudomonas alcaliphila]MDX5992490.1 hypothetical protein [Pseudomonas alcaliphila]SDD86387.1 hypothetical protein SAMN05216575_1011463 [Pseudomonas alcaliphila]